MIRLQRGDALPIVATAQTLLNRRLRDDGLVIEVDGRFGSETVEAVRRFQAVASLHTNGIVGGDTWSKLVEPEGLQIVDHVDVTDPTYGEYEDHGTWWSGEVRDLWSAGGSPILSSPALSSTLNGVIGQMVTRYPAGSVALMRFFGHGAPGGINIAQGASGSCSESLALDITCRPAWRRQQTQFLRLRPLFSSLGSLEFHGCNCGMGSAGARFVRQLSSLLGVPVSAGVQFQYGGHSRTLRFEGWVRSAFPNGEDLGTWAEGLPD